MPQPNTANVQPWEGPGAKTSAGRVLSSAMGETSGKLTRFEGIGHRVFENSAIGIAVTDMDGRFLSANAAYQELVGYPEEELRALTFLELTHEGDRKKNRELIEELLADKTAQFQIDKRYRRKDGRIIWVSNNVSLIPGDAGSPRCIIAIVKDITKRKQTEALLAGENRLLEMVAQGDSLSSILTALCRLFEELCSGSLTSVLLLDATTRQLWHGAAPSLPAEYTEAINGGVIGPSAGSCGTAAYRGEPVIVSDIAVDPLWRDYRDIALAHGLRACWSMPLFSTERRVLGTFATYFRQPGAPTQQQQDVIEHLAHLANIAIERTRAQEALRRSKAYLAQAQKLSRTGSFGWNIASGELFWSEETFCIVGFDPAVKPTLDLVFKRVHPEDIRLVQQTLDLAVRDGSNLDFEHRLLLPDGSVKYVHVVARPVADPSGKLEFVGAVMDVTPAKQAFRQIQELKDQLHRENIVLREQVDAASMFEEIVGNSPALQEMLARVAKVAHTESTVLIMGETGTGKELIARAIHKRSARSGHAFVSVNCAAIPPSLIASELFGHEKGAFTGALQRRPGRFELAQGGTLFLDEVGELPAEIQVALLRVLQEREFERVGGAQPIRADVRVIAATNRDLKAAIIAGKFRSDLYYRLNVFPIEMPSLHARKEDIPMLTEYFIHRYAGQMGKKISRIRRKTLALFQSYPWPGNIRELQNVIERSLILCETDTFSVDESWLAREPVGAGSLTQPLPKKLATDEKAMIEIALAATRGRISGPAGAATKLGMPASTLESKIRALKINKHQFRASP